MIYLLWSEKISIRADGLNEMVSTRYMKTEPLSLNNFQFKSLGKTLFSVFYLFLFLLIY